MPTKWGCHSVTCGEGRPIFFPFPNLGGLSRQLVGFVVDAVEPEARPVALRPLKVIHERPVHVPPHVRALAHRLAQGCEHSGHIPDAARVGLAAVGDAALGDEDGLPVALVEGGHHEPKR